MKEVNCLFMNKNIKTCFKKYFTTSINVHNFFSTQLITKQNIKSPLLEM